MQEVGGFHSQELSLGASSIRETGMGEAPGLSMGIVIKAHVGRVGQGC